MTTLLSKRALSAGLGAGGLALLAQRASADTPLTRFAFPVTGGTTARTLPDRFADVKNVKDFGATGNGVTDDADAIQAAIDWNTRGSSQRIIFFPIGAYRVGSPIILDKGGPHISIRLMGCGGDISSDGGSLIIGNFGDFIFKKASSSQSSAVKIIEGFTIKNTHAAGGSVYISGSSHAAVRDCGIYSNMYGVIFDQMNAPHGVENCSFRSFGNPANSVGLSLGGTGGYCRASDFVGWEDGIRFSMGGNFISDCRLEVNGKAINVGAAPQFQRVRSYASNGSGGTRLTVTSTALYTAIALAGLGEGQLTIGGATGTPALNGLHHVTWVDATHIDVNVPFVASNSTTFLGGLQGAFVGGSGQITSCTFEGNDYGVYCAGFNGGIVSGCGILGHNQGPSGQSIAGIYLRGCSGVSFLGNVATGGYSLGALYQDVNATTFGNTFQGNQFSNGLVLTGGPYTNTAGPFTIRRGTLNDFPGWIVNGLTVAPGGVVQSGTTIASFNAGAGTITLNQTIVGTLAPDSPPGLTSFSFKDAVTGFAVGGYHFPHPAGDQNKGTGLVSRISGNVGLSYTHYEDIEMNPRGGTIALTINNDASFGAPSTALFIGLRRLGLGPRISQRARLP